MHTGCEGGEAWASHSVAKTVLAVGTMQTVLLLLCLEAGGLGPTLSLHVVFSFSSVQIGDALWWPKG